MDTEKKIIQYESNILKQAFYNKDVIPEIRDKIEDGFFNTQFNTIVWKSYLFILDNDEALSKSTIEDVFINAGNKDHINTFWNVISAEYPDEGQWKYQYKFLYELFTKSKILKLINDIKEMMAEHSASDLIDHAIEELTKYDFREDPSYTVKESISRALKEIRDRREGRIIPFIRTGYDEFDILAKLDFRKIILIAAAKKIGKTKFIINLLMEILEIDPTIAIKFYSFELSEKELIYEIVSRDVNLSTDEIQSKGYVLSDEEIDKIEESMIRFENLDFDINTTPTSIGRVKADFIKFCKKRNTNRCILVIDNIGLLSDTGNSQTEIDDHIAKTMVDIRESTKGLIFPIHHMAKSLEHHDRLKDGYRPRPEHLKGSTRISDYANMVILLHRPGFYDDLVARESLKGLIKLKRGKFKRYELIMRIFIVDIAINRSGETGMIHFLHKLKYCQFKEF